MATRTISIAQRAAAAVIALLFALTFALASAANAHAAVVYDLWVGGVRVTSDNASDVLGDGGSVAFQAGTGNTYELTLDGALIVIADVPGSSIDAAGIYTKNDLVITVTGSRSIITPGSAATNSNIQAIEADNSVNVTIKGDSTLTTQIMGYSGGGLYGVWGHGFLDVIGDVSIEIMLLSSDADAFAIAMDKGVHVGDNAVLNIYAGSHGSNSYGIWGKKITFDGNSKSSVTARGTAGNNAGVWSNGIVSIEDTASVQLSAMAAGITANDIYVSDNGFVNVHTDRGGSYGLKLSNSSGTIGITGYALVNIISYQAFSHVPDMTGYHDPCAYVGVGTHPGDYTLVEEITPSNYQYGFVRIPGKPVIHRIAGDYANETAAKISEFMAPDAFMPSSQAVVLARDDDFADALGATGLAGALDAPILLTDRESLSPAAAAEINRLGAYEIYIIGGPGAMKEQLEKDLIEQCGVYKEDIIRVYGENSYDTSLECAKKIVDEGGSNGAAIIAMSTNFQDALSMSPIAYQDELPIILQTWGATSADRGFTDEAKAFLADKTLIVAGGTGAISDASLEGLYVDERLWGETGYDTSEAIAEWAVFEEEILDPYAAVIACGAQAPKGTDALAGAALAGMYGAPILLVNGNEAMEAANTVTIDGYLKDIAPYVQECYVLGGTYVVPPELFTKIQETINAHEAINM